MSDIIDSTYEILEELGSGGGGVVYRARHKRLNKEVVIKVDKREITTDPDILMREANALKNLNNSYIPTVYDFVIENGMVYTVIDYIPGESLDKPLKRGVRFPQAQIIEWACELLDALSYLHKRPPYGILHSDIKPANVMLTPEGDIRLIDFNIALALGAEGSVLLGFSPGYASPEHYGYDYRSGNRNVTLPLNTGSRSNDPNATVPLNNSGMQSSSSVRRNGLLLDKRSDIYSLGATLYHLLSGERPNHDFNNLNKLTAAQVSPQIAEIINKAMNPDPDLRYQSADEMLAAFTHLHDNDPRTKRLKRNNVIAAAVAGIMLLAGSSCIFGGLQLQKAEAKEAQAAAEQSEAEAIEAKKAAEQAEEAERIEKEKAQAAEEAERAAKEKEQQEKEKAQRAENALQLINRANADIKNGDVRAAAEKAAEALALATEHDAEAQNVLTKALGVYDVFDGYQAHGAIQLSAEALKLRMSGDGTRLAGLSSGAFEIFDTETGALVKKLEALPSALSVIEFFDDNTVVYASPDGIEAFDLSADKELWKGNLAASIAVSADKKRVAAVYKDESRAFIYDAQTGAVLREVDFKGLSQPVVMVDTFADPEDATFALNGDGGWLAVSFVDGSIGLYNTQDEDQDAVIFDGGSDYNYFEGGFYKDYFAVAAFDGKSSFAACLDMRDFCVAVSFPETTSAYRLRVNEYGIWIANGATVNDVDLENSKMTEAAFTSAPIVSFEAGKQGVAAVLEDGRVCIFDPYGNMTDEFTDMGKQAYVQRAGAWLSLGRLDSESVRILKMTQHLDNELAVYDGNYSHSETRVCADGSRFMQFNYKGFRISDSSGRMIAEVELPNAKQVYDQQFIHHGSVSSNKLVQALPKVGNADEDRLLVYYYDGTLQAYSANDGTLLGEVKTEKPDESLQDEFVTDRWRIVAPLHGAPEIYDTETGELKGKLEQDAYLTYVTQIGENIVVQYLNSDKHQYGLILDAAGDVIAELPYLCDILPDGTLVFDDMKGTLRKSKIYGVEELINLE